MDFPRQSGLVVRNPGKRVGHAELGGVDDSVVPDQRQRKLQYL